MTRWCVRLERRDDGVAVVTLDNPKVNALSRGLLRQLADGRGRAHRADPPGAVVVTGGERIFAAGADITEFGGAGRGPRASAPASTRALDAVADIPRSPSPRSAATRSAAGASWPSPATSASPSERAVFGQPEILLGIIPGGGGTQRLPRLVGPARAKDLILTGRQVKADEALRIGLVDEVVPPDELHERALAQAAELAARPAGRPGAGQAGHRRGPRPALADGLDLEQQLFVEVFDTDDSQIGVQSFLEHGPGQGRVHRPLIARALLAPEASAQAQAMRPSSTRAGRGRGGWGTTRTVKP